MFFAERFATYQQNCLKTVHIALPLHPGAGLTIGQTGQMPGASRLGIKTLLYWFFIFLDCSPRVKIVELLIIAFGVLVREADNFGIYRF